MVTNLPSDEPPHPDASPEASGPSRPRRLTLDGSSTVTFEVLQAEWEQVEDELPGPVGLRVHRALSWLERAEKEEDDPDAAFIFYWIAFNAAYAQDRPRPPESTERNHFAVFFNAISLGGKSTSTPSSKRAPSTSELIRFFPPYSGRQHSPSLRTTLYTKNNAQSRRFI